jgi:hypothetical protein
MSLYHDYKPFRNFTRQFDLEASMLDVWHYALFLTDDKPLPPHYAASRAEHQFVSLKTLVHPWELEIIARELILNAGRSGDCSLAKWSDLRAAINHVRRLDEITFELSDDKMRDVLIELHRLAHRQFPWQIKPTVNTLVRAFRVYGSPQMDALVKRELGLTTYQFIRLGIAVAGGFRNRPYLSTTQDYSCLGIPLETSKAFLSRLSCDINSLRKETRAHQSYDRDWVYAWNPLEATPLISLDVSHPELLVCPLPALILKRVTSGLYFDIVKSAGFDNPFGDSFQTYIGDVLKVACHGPRFATRAEAPYYIGGNLHHGTDWIVSDVGGHVFIECKTKRLRLDAKTRSDTKALEKDVLVLAKAIVQHYGNVKNALDGKTDWTSGGRPIYPLILTMEDWFIFSPRIDELLNSEVTRLFSECGLDLSFLERMPFTIASAHEFEIAIQIIAEVGISKVMAAKAKGEHRTWGLAAFLGTTFADEIKRVNWAVFGDDLRRLVGVPS